MLNESKKGFVYMMLSNQHAYLYHVFRKCSLLIFVEIRFKSTFTSVMSKQSKFHYNNLISPYIINNKRKPPCIDGMELVSLSCNRVFISAESVWRGWCKIAIATKWYQFHTTDKCGFLFMPWITDQYTFVRDKNIKWNRHRCSWSHCVFNYDNLV